MPTDNLSLYTPLSLQSISHSQQGSLGSDPYASSYNQRNMMINNASYSRGSSIDYGGYPQQQSNTHAGYTFPTPAHMASQQYMPSNLSPGIPLSSASSSSHQYMSSQSHQSSGHGHGHSLPALSHHSSGVNSQGLYAQQQGYHMSAGQDRDGLTPSPSSGVAPGYHTPQ